MNALFMFVLFLVIPAVSAVAADGNIALWPKGARGAVSITWDDNERPQFTTVAPLMHSYGIRGTFFVSTSLVHDWDSVRAAAAMGHEIGSHSVTHARLDEVDTQQVHYEVRRSKEIIDSLVTSQRCRTFAYPWCQFAQAETFVRENYIAARVCGGGLAPDTGQTIEPASPDSLYRVLGAHVDRQGEAVTAWMLNRYIDKLIADGGWLVELHHGIDGVGYKWMYADTFALHLNYIADKGDSIWAAPFGDVVRYILERDCAVLTRVTASEFQHEYTLVDTLADDSVFNLPLTVMLELPQGWRGASVFQNGDTLWSAVRADTLLFEARPDQGTVILKETALMTRRSPGIRHSFSVSVRQGPGPFRFRVDHPGSSIASVVLYRVDGQVAGRPVKAHTRCGMTEFSLDRDLAAGLYILVPQAGDTKRTHALTIAR